MNSKGARRFAVLTLFLMTPLVAEYLLGDLPLRLLGVVVILAPAYGGAAVLIREMARQTGRGWPMIFLLSAAFAMANEGLVTQSLFNHDYLRMQMHLLDHAYVARLGVGAWWTLLMLNLHTFWSMGVSIALVEALFAAEAETAWLGRFGTAVVGALFALGLGLGCLIGYKQNHFIASKAQLVSVAVVSALLIAGGFLVPAVGRRGAGRMPSAWATGAVALLMGLGVYLRRRDGDGRRWACCWRSMGCS